MITHEYQAVMFFALMVFTAACIFAAIGFWAIESEQKAIKKSKQPKELLYL